MAASALKENKSIMQIGTLADWSYDDQVTKMQKELRKTLKKSLKTKSVQNNKINTFTVTSVELDELPELSKRLNVENRVKQVLHDYSDRINATHQKRIKYNGDTKVYLKAFKSLKLDLKDEIIKVQHEFIDQVESKVKEIVTSSFVAVWTMASNDPDKVIIGDFTAQVDTKIDQALDDMIDELLITNLGSQFLPFTRCLLDDLHETLVNLGDLNKLVISENKHVNSIIYQIIGTVSGLQESLKLLARQITHVHKMMKSNIQELKEYESEDLLEWLESFESLDVVHSLQRVNEIDQMISSTKLALRSVKKIPGLANGRLIYLQGTMSKFIKLRAQISGMRHWITRFESLPNFTNLKEGIAYEEVENENYEVSDNGNMIEATKIFKNYSRGGSTIYALRGIELEIKAGEFAIVMGPSGSGKTTLLNILAGLETVNRGAVFFEGEDILQMKDRKKSNLRKNNFSFIFQNYALIPHLTAHENVKVPLDLTGLSKELQKDIQSLLDSVGIGPYADHKPALLSGGQMQRLGIARALIAKPQLIFADEPTGDLDRKTSLTIMDLLKKYHEETGVTIVLVTHDKEIAKYGTRQIHVKDGQII